MMQIHNEAQVTPNPRDPTQRGGMGGGRGTIVPFKKQYFATHFKKQHYAIHFLGGYGGSPWMQGGGGYGGGWGGDQVHN